MSRRTQDTSSPSGAKLARTSGRQTFVAWWGHHRRSCRDSLLRLLQTPMQSLLTWLVIAIAVALPAGLYLGLQNLQQLGDGWQDSAQMSVFLKRSAKPAAIDALRTQLAQNPQIKTIDTIDPASALAEFQRFSGLGDVLNSLDENPLPTVFIVEPAISIQTPEQLDQLKVQIAGQPVIDSVQLDMGWLRRLHELLSLGERLVLSLAALLSLGVLLIIGNTLRLAIENRRDEIIVTKLVGGTNGFVRRPFLYTGFWYGVGGGLFAVLVILLLGLWISGPVSRLVSLYESEYALSGLGMENLALLLLASAFLGWLGAWIAVSRHLRGIEPR